MFFSIESKTWRSAYPPTLCFNCVNNLPLLALAKPYWDRWYQSSVSALFEFYQPNDK
jgi:hypothetical protein